MKNIFRLSIPTLLIFLIVILSQGCKKTSSTNGRTPMGTWVLNGMESDELDSEIYYSNQPPTYTTYWVTSDVSNVTMVIAGQNKVFCAVSQNLAANTTPTVYSSSYDTIPYYSSGPDRDIYRLDDPGIGTGLGVAIELDYFFLKDSIYVQYNWNTNMYLGLSSNMYISGKRK